MAVIQSLSVANFRNLVIPEVEFSPQFNVLTGENAAGKSSVLEAILFLGTLKSFRTANVQELIARDASCAVVRATAEVSDGLRCVLAAERCKSGLRLRMNQEPLSRASEFIAQLPILALHAQSDDLLLAGPDHRRRFLDRLAFYLLPEFFAQYAQFNRVLKQRNAALKARQSVHPWNELFVRHATNLSAARARALALLMAALPGVLAAVSPQLQVSAEFHPGHSGGDLLEALQRSAIREQELRQTLVGPHRADIVLTTPEGPLKALASRGQIKVFVLALTLAVAEVWRVHRAHRAILLFDDFMTELDGAHLSLVFEYLQSFGHQAFFTTVDARSYPDHFAARFVLRGGQLSSVV
ncbi:DNA replication/repair protein RecF [Halothiobacillus sp. DCM-1]|uniref:DNA replication/repair protein RecF n=1 Tax=Halothiobacillus sp. DCM-1 TaxID=3112558 RepID=UPI0032465F50